MVERRLIKIDQHWIVPEIQKDELPQPEQGVPEYFHALFEEQSGHLVFSIGRSHGQSKILFPSFEPPRIWNDYFRRFAVQQARVGIICEELPEFDTQR